MGRRRSSNIPDLNLAFNPIDLGLPTLVLLLVVWIALGGVVYQVQPDEEGVVTRFGKVVERVGPGLHFKLPWPIHGVQTPPVLKAKRLEIGFETIDPGPPARYRNSDTDPRLRAESEMLTGDENIVDSELIVQYQIASAEDYLFNTDRPEEALRDLVEAAQRQVVGDRPIDDVLTTGKTAVQAEMEASIQELSDTYGLGFNIITVKLQAVEPPPEVAASFKDVATAREDREKIINQASGYANEQMPRARGEAARLMREAEGYRQERIAEAEGDVARFVALAQEYEKAPEVTKRRLYLETMKRVLKGTRKTIIDDNSGVLNLNDLQTKGGQS